MLFNQWSKKSTYIITQVALASLALILVLFVIEGLLQLKKGMRRVDDIPYIVVNGLHVFTPNVDTIVTGGAFVPIHVKTNADGFASPAYPVSAVSNTVRIAVLGNSFTRGFEVDYDKKFTSLTEQYLRERDPARQYEVMNFGIGGYSFVDQLFVYEWYVKKYHPQLVILVVTPTPDFNTTRVFLPEEKYITATPVDQLSASRLLRLKAVLSDTSSTTATASRQQLELVRFVRGLLAVITGRLHTLSIAQMGVMHTPVVFLYKQWLRLSSFDPVAVQAVSLGDDDRAFFNPADNDRLALMRFTTGLADTLGKTARADGAKFAVAIIPNYWQVDKKYAKQLDETLPSSYDIFLPNTIFQQVVGAHFPILDLSERTARAINEEHTQVFIRDSGHFTAAGHQMVARSIVDFIDSKHFFRP